MTGSKPFQRKQKNRPHFALSFDRDKLKKKNRGWLAAYKRGGYIKFTFLPKIEADNMWASLTMPQGTLRKQTETVVQRLEKAVEQVRREFDAKRKGKNPSIIRHMATDIGEQPFDIQQF